MSFMVADDVDGRYSGHRQNGEIDHEGEVELEEVDGRCDATQRFLTECKRLLKLKAKAAAHSSLVQVLGFHCWFSSLGFCFLSLFFNDFIPI